MATSLSRCHVHLSFSAVAGKSAATLFDIACHELVNLKIVDYVCLTIDQFLFFFPESVPALITNFLLVSYIGFRCGDLTVSVSVHLASRFFA